jgi:hypothetical protein
LSGLREASRVAKTIQRRRGSSRRCTESARMARTAPWRRDGRGHRRRPPGWLPRSSSAVTWTGPRSGLGRPWRYRERRASQKRGSREKGWRAASPLDATWRMTSSGSVFGQSGTEQGFASELVLRVEGARYEKDRVQGA